MCNSVSRASVAGIEWFAMQDVSSPRLFAQAPRWGRWAALGRAVHDQPGPSRRAEARPGSRSQPLEAAVRVGVLRRAAETPCERALAARLELTGLHRGARTLS